MALHCKTERAKTVCSLRQSLLVLLKDKSCMKGDFHVRFCEKLEVRFLLLKSEYSKIAHSDFKEPSYYQNNFLTHHTLGYTRSDKYHHSSLY